jgi:hypothetical protein
MCARVDLLPLPFEGSKEEEPIPILRIAVAQGNRAADVPTRILVLALWLGRLGGCVGSIVCRQTIVAPVVVHLAVEFGGARLRDAADVHPPRAVLGRKVRALHLHFLNHVVVQGDNDAVVTADIDQR